MFTIQDAQFVRFGYSGNETFAEVEVRTAEAECALIATFKKQTNGSLRLVNVTENRENLDLDWYENNMHEAYPNAMTRLFGESGNAQDGEAQLRAFEQAVLAYGNMQETLEDQFYYGS